MNPKFMEIVIKKEMHYVDLEIRWNGIHKKQEYQMQDTLQNFVRGGSRIVLSSDIIASIERLEQAFESAGIPVTYRIE
jgi:isochorismate hydrolase